MTGPQKAGKINLLICDDSKLILELLSGIFSQYSDIHVLGTASNGQEAIDLTEKLKPDLITMDVSMPIINGFEATKYIMEHFPTPIIIVSSLAKNKELNIAFEALNAGALSVIDKPSRILSANFKNEERHFINSIRALSQVNVIRRNTSKTINKLSSITDNNQKFDIVALGLSTGGPEALKVVLSSLPSHFPLPIVIVLHITEGFLQGLVSWLNDICALPISIAQHNMSLLPGNIYFAPDNKHLRIKKAKTPMAILCNSEKVHHLKPSVSVLFHSLCESYPNSSIAGVLTGMGADGADGLLALKQTGAYTFGQTEKTCTIYGMPRAAKKAGAVLKEVDLSAVSELLTILIK